jgi:hypothetical protein
VAKVKNNPFKFGDPVEGGYYLERPELSHYIGQLLDSRIHAVLIGPRRFGKTSFALNLLRERESEEKTGLFVDIFNVTSHRDFLQQILRALRRKPRLRPKLSVEPNLSGQSAWGLSADVIETDVKDTIQDVLAGLATLDRHVIVVIDEFQKVAELDDAGWLEATLRTHMQHLKNTVFLFTGSRRSIIYDMINNASRPFYRSCQSIEFPAFGPEFTDWVIQRFKQVGITAEKSAIQYLRACVQDSPNYVQMAGFHLVAKGVKRVGQEEVNGILKTIVRQNAYAYQTLLNTLTSIQQRALRLAAQSKAQVFAKDLLQKFEIPSGAALASAFKALKDRQILDEGTAKGKVVFDDPLFEIWLKTEFGEG